MKTIYILMLSGALMWSCAKDNDISSGDGTPEGIPTKVDISLDDVSQRQRQEYFLSTEEEKTVKSARVLIFNSGGNVVTNTYFPSVSVSTGIQSIETYSGSNMSVYVITNITAIGADFIRLFDNVKTLADLQNLKVYNIGDDVDANRQLVMWGVASGVTIPPAPTSGNILVPLNYVASKVHVNIIDDTPLSESVSWTTGHIRNQSKVSYILPKGSDAANPATATDYIAETAPFSWRDTTFVVGGVSKPGKYTEFYLFENRRGGRVANASTPPAGYTPGAIDANDPKDKPWYAPAKATVVVADGIYFTGSSSRGIMALIYLGGNNSNDYNIERTKEYTYNVTVKGINNINVDARVEDTGNVFQVDLLNPTLDSHYDWRPLQISSRGGTATIEILDATGLAPVIPSTFWLKVSSINLNQAVNVSGSYVRPTYSPANDMKTVINNIAFTNPNAVTSVMYYLYADEYLTEGGSRAAKVRITNSQAPASPIVIDITQKGYQTMGSAVGLRGYDNLGGILLTSSYRIAFESIEESRLTLTPGSSTESTLSMQWGFSGIKTQSLSGINYRYYSRNGFENTSAAVMSNTVTGTLRAPYGRINNTTISEQVHNPIHNTYAARYCFEKNRDVDGDGKIVGNEVKWYLPSIDELILMYVANPSINTLSNEQVMDKSYFSSTEYTDNSNAMGLTFSSGTTGLATKVSDIYVRCVRKL